MLTFCLFKTLIISAVNSFTLIKFSLTNKEALVLYCTLIKPDGHLRTRGKTRAAGECFLHISSVLKYPECFITV